MPERHFPEPWSVDELDTCFVVKDLNGQALAYMYFEKEPRHRHRRSELLTRDEAQRIAAILPSCRSCYSGPDSTQVRKSSGNNLRGTPKARPIEPTVATKARVRPTDGQSRGNTALFLFTPLARL